VDKTGSRSVALRGGGALLLLLGEGLCLGIQFDTASLLSQHDHSQWFEILGWVMPLAAALLTAALLVAGPRLHLVLSGMGGDVAALSGRRVVVLALHLAAFAGVCALGHAVFRGTSNAEGSAQRLAMWLALCGAAFLLWLLWVVPLAALRIVVRETGVLLAAAMVIGVAAWAAGRYTQTWWDALREPTLTGVITLLRFVDSTAWAEPRRLLIGAGRFTAEIAPHCSGAEGIGLITVFLGAYFWLFREHLRLRRVVWLIPLGWVAAWATNVLRITLLVWIGGHISPDLAAGGFHSYAGPLLFSVVALGLAALSRTPSFRACQQEPDADALVNPAAPFLVPLLATVAAGLAAGLLVTPATRAFAPGIHLAAALTALACFGARYREARVFDRPTWVGFAAGTAAFAAWLALAKPPAGIHIPDAPPAHLPLLWLILRAADYVLVAPIVEELAFRGYLARRVVSGDFDRVPTRDLSWFAVACSAVLFGLLHRQWAAGTAAGLAFGWAAKQSGRLGDAVAAHLVCNAMVTAHVLATGTWWRWT
jgi:exosortase E/protease (VPEID-CTERM system)